MIGQIISHYKIIEKLGEGGMGVVYKAEDTKLHRSVALKFLASNASSSPEDSARFEQEARAISTLNHPHIATIYEVDEVDGRKFTAFEFLQGGTLRDRIKRAAATGQNISPREIVDYGIQIAEGLAHAHHHQIIHRDIKTENMLLTEEGNVKITDFGLAKIQGSIQLTNVGSALGTAAYMSPEQVRGDELDARTDLFSFGIVLYELSTGHLPFKGEHVAALGYSIVNEPPIDIRTYRSDIPSSLENVILHCLEKDATKRYQTAEEIIIDLKKIQQELLGTIPDRASQSKKFIFAAVLLSVGLAAGIYFIVQSRSGEGSSKPMRLLFTQVTSAEGVEEFPAWSPDGNLLAFSGEVNGYKKIFIKKLVTGEETQITKGSFDDIQAAWTKDGNAILFVRSHQPNGKIEPGDIFGEYDGGDIWSVDLSSGSIEKLIENGFNPSVSPDGKSIAFDASLSGTRRIWVADIRGRNARQVSTDSSEAVAHISPHWSPDGSHIVFQNMERTTFDLKTVDLHSGKMAWVTNDLFRDIGPVWSPSGTSIYFTSDRGGGLNIWQIPVSSEGTRSGQPEQLTTGAGQDVDIAISPDGKKLVYTILKLNADIWRLPVSADSGKAIGDPQQVIATTREDSRGAWSPDGTSIAFNSDRTGDMNIWLYSIRDGSARQLTKGRGGDFQPNWSPDGKQVVFFSSRSGNADIWQADVSTGELQQLTKNSSLDINPFYSPDGNYIAFQSDMSGRLEPWVMKNDGADQHRLANMEVSGHFMRWSRDGASLIFRSPNSSQPGLWKAPLNGGEPVFFITSKGGSHISFSPQYDLIMDVIGHKEMWVTPLRGEPLRKIFEFSDPEIRIDYPVWSPDGKWVLFDRVKPQGGDIWLVDNIE